MSVLMLMARSTIYKVLGLLTLMVVVEGGLFCYTLSLGFGEINYGLELLIRQSRISWVFGAAFVAVTYLLTRTGWKGGSKQGYTLMRLSISERWVFFWQSVYNAVCYVILWAVQVLVVMLLCWVYTIQAPEGYVTGQTVFLAFYRSDFLHSLLPFEDALLWVTNILLVASLSICAAHYPMEKRRGKRFEEITGMSCAAIAWFTRGIGDIVPCLFAILAALLAGSTAIFRNLESEAEDET